MSLPTPAPISVVVITRNEERNLPVALRSVAGWTQEIIVVDMESSDGTVQVATSFGASVYTHEPIGFSEPARAFGASKAASDWILILDADELITPGLAKRMRERIAEDETDAVWLPFSNYLFGRRMVATSWASGRSKHLRLFRRTSVHLPDRIHELITPVQGARVGAIPYATGTCVIHFNYTTIRQFIEKTNRYTGIEASQARESGRKAPSAVALVGRPIAEFVNQWVVKRGYRDGWPGLYIAALMAFYRFAERAKLREILENGADADVEEAYARLAEEWLKGNVPD